MFINMLKKEFTVFFRNKGEVFMLFVFPIILITTLSLGLKSMMEYSSDIFEVDGKDSIVYYAVEEDAKEYSMGFEAFKEGVEEAVALKFEETSSLDEVEEDVDNYDALAFINVEKDGFSFYTSKKGEKVQSKIVKSMFESLLNEYSIYSTVGEYNPEAIRNLVSSEFESYVENESIGDARNLTSTEFYTFAELALIVMYISSYIAESVYSENKLNTINRIKLSKSSEHIIVLAKVVMGCLLSIMQTILIYIYTSLCLNLDWGGNVLKFFTLYIALGLFASTLGVVVGTISKKDTTASAILNAIIIFISFLGGCYVPLSQIIKMPGVNNLIFLSPIYWIDTAISSSLCNIQSNSYAIALAVPLGLSVIMVSIYLLGVRRKGGLANA